MGACGGIHALAEGDRLRDGENIAVIGLHAAARMVGRNFEVRRASKFFSPEGLFRLEAVALQIFLLPEGIIAILQRQFRQRRLPAGIEWRRRFPPLPVRARG